MKESPIFLRTTKKLYEEVNKRKGSDGHQGFPHHTHLDISIEKDFFEVDEWAFLNEHKNRFKFPVQINGETHKLFNVYQIEDDELKTNELNVLGIRNKFLK